ncbi:MAG: hypothetical protein BWX84_02780 [Verrucomicrobia bacterium ADurb.Bin118]|nr:MAG: hypothetical protein BWX84_02780 [Verrucomicrobia bacterium ADurb.Bin118]
MRRHPLALGTLRAQSFLRGLLIALPLFRLAAVGLQFLFPTGGRGNEPGFGCFRFAERLLSSFEAGRHPGQFRRLAFELLFERLLGALQFRHLGLAFLQFTRFGRPRRLIVGKDFGLGFQLCVGRVQLLTQFRLGRGLTGQFGLQLQALVRQFFRPGFRLANLGFRLVTVFGGFRHLGEQLLPRIRLGAEHGGCGIIVRLPALMFFAQHGRAPLQVRRPVGVILQLHAQTIRQRLQFRRPIGGGLEGLLFGQQHFGGAIQFRRLFQNLVFQLLGDLLQLGFGFLSRLQIRPRVIAFLSQVGQLLLRASADFKGLPQLFINRRQFSGRMISGR